MVYRNQWFLGFSRVLWFDGFLTHKRRTSHVLRHSLESCPHRHNESKSAGPRIQAKREAIDRVHKQESSTPYKVQGQAVKEVALSRPMNSRTTIRPLFAQVHEVGATEAVLPPTDPGKGSA